MIEEGLLDLLDKCLGGKWFEVLVVMDRSFSERLVDGSTESSQSVGQSLNRSPSRWINRSQQSRNTER